MEIGFRLANVHSSGSPLKQLLWPSNYCPLPASSCGMAAVGGLTGGKLGVEISGPSIPSPSPMLISLFPPTEGARRRELEEMFPALARW
jgi:hypothetical protein